MPSCMNMMNIKVLQFLAQSELKLQVCKLSLWSLRISDPNLVNFCLNLIPYFLAQFLEKLGPYF